MKLVIHDYAGHPGQVHLSRELARRGHQVEHQYCASYTTGRGATERREGDPETFSVRALDLGREFARYSPLVRLYQELRYARLALQSIVRVRPDVAVLSNVPLLSLFLVTIALRVTRIPYVFWQQDVYSDAINVVARQRLGRVGGVIGWFADRAERTAARGASGVVPISEAFLDRFDSWKIPRSRIRVIPNWAAVDEMPQRDRDNAWARAHDNVGVPVAMYAGTLGLKHDPSLLAKIAKSAPAGARIVVVSQGQGREWLERHAVDVPSLELLDYQPYEQLPDMLGSADVLIAVLERDASRYSVPSKVLNYFCAGRPVLGLVPPDNAVAHMIESAQAGVVVDPGDPDAAAAALNHLLADPLRREELGSAARQYAETKFDVVAVGEVFEAVLAAAVA
ncbi:glycosyltransferase family 4 protein [Mycobacterium sp. NPDC051804]|uniref:glycosyltransferase family 4 protein n=1 Tax=Mycobacterium sp. NPDC051804 TaxID=3364295 RepID=UPI0037B7AE72